ncbi:phycobilisome protein [Gloeocapsopsis dulcis]|uniref:Phycobilisome protein n=1 Tax=Gloeocapsopsis dulcis AAB1 = 1H9 TaxID=1433147 RepID=A0A6N8FVQ6_9CHRO|nr:phycobilisome protein [Gloeocapsopsis dulcis]MUL36854.1 phycobilisome protein [Gloeocapsopsis dulcis AAB1 = 1H9]WNN88538.1 phycobilisome protein [Gloeocapsopsis dulcis]
MLTQLTRLSIEADGCYAKAEQLQFLKNYFQSLDQRVSAYEKIRSAEAEIISQVEAKMRALDPNLFCSATGDFTETWRRDIVQLLRYAAAALLFNDQERLREGLLLWHNTIAKSYQFDRTCKTTFTLMPEVIQQYLTLQETALFSPILELNYILLS